MGRIFNSCRLPLAGEADRVLILFLPIALALNYRFLSRGNPTDLVWLTLLGIAGVGLSNPALYLLPAISVCSWVAFFTLKLFEHRSREYLWKLIRLGLFLTIPLAYPIAILALLKMDVIPKPIDIHSLGQDTCHGAKRWTTPLVDVLITCVM